jgi:hypothetical protein
MSEDARMAIFDAAAFALALFFGSEPCVACAKETLNRYMKHNRSGTAQ